MKTVPFFAASLFASASLFGFVAERAWSTGDVQFLLHLDASSEKPALPASGLSDGSASWNTVAAAALEHWNPHLARIQLKNTASTAAPAMSNNFNEITFSAKQYDDDFGTNVLAITLSRYQNDVRQVEADIIVNNKYTWDSYRGQNRSGASDLRRVLIHEIGHALGLNHPDERGQSVTAVMNARVGNTDGAVADDIAGAQALYKDPIVVPTITQQPQSRTVNETDSADMFVRLNNAEPPPATPLLQYNWLFQPPNRAQESILQPFGRVALGTAQLYDAGRYRLRISTPDGSVTSSAAELRVNPVSRSSSTRLYNLSTRGIVGKDNRALIAGFVVQTPGTRKLLIRGIGPRLSSAFGIQGAVPNPRMQLFNSANALVASNDDWTSSPGVNAALFAQNGAFNLDGDSTSCAVLVDLPQGSYTAMITPSGSSSEGIGIVEVYDLTPTSSANDRLINISTRGFVENGMGMMVGGLSIKGTAPRTYLIRAAGDTLKTLDPTNIKNPLDDPVLQLKNNAGVLARYADDWDNPEFHQPTLSAAMTATGAFPITDRQESAMLLTLQPGNYTVEAFGMDGTSGVGLLEVYEMPMP